MELKSCKEVAAALKDGVRRGIEKCLSVPSTAGWGAPKLVVINTYPTEASRAYTRGKIKDCEEVGIEVKLIENEAKEPAEIQKLILEESKTADGIIVQLPLNPNLAPFESEIVSIIPNDLDVDGLGKGGFYTPATVRGIFEHLGFNDITVAGKSVVVYGRSKIVGKPFADLALANGATVTVCHSQTPRGLELEYLKNADIVVCATGVELFTDVELAERLKENAIVYDVGIRRTDEGLKGDIKHTGIGGLNITPVPGGVGLLTRVGLIRNVFSSWLWKIAR